MKIEFIKETSENLEVCYYTNINDKIVDGSLKFDREIAKKIYDMIKVNYSTQYIEVLETFEIN